MRCTVGHVPAADAWLYPPLYIQNLDELVQLDHNADDLPRMVLTGDTASTPSAAPVGTSAALSESTRGNEAAAGKDEPARFVYSPQKNATGRYNHYDVVAR